VPTDGPLKSRNNSKLNKENNKQAISGKGGAHLDSSENQIGGGEDEEKNKLRAQISMLRCQVKRMGIDNKEQKSTMTKEINSLKDKLKVEKKKRMNIYEEKIDKNNQLLQDLLEKDQVIFNLQGQISRLQQDVTRTHTPNQNDQLLQSMLQSQSMIEPKGLHSYSSKMLSPLRSLDLTGNASF